MGQSFGHRLADAQQSEWSRIKAADEQRKLRRDFEDLQRDTQLSANATAQTVRKLRADMVDRLAEKELLSSEQQRAAQEVMQVWTGITSPLFTKSGSLERVSGGCDSDWAPGLTKAYCERYAPWRDEMSRVLVCGNTTMCDLVFLIVCDNLGLRQAANRLGMDQRTVLRKLQASLYAYAELAGWTDQRTPPLISAMVRQENSALLKLAS